MRAEDSYCMGASVISVKPLCTLVCNVEDSEISQAESSKFSGRRASENSVGIADSRP